MTLDRLRIAKHQFVLQATEPIHLMPYLAASLRGGFGHAFKRMACQEPDGCSHKCNRPEHCAYGYVFETSPPSDSEVLRTHEAVPRPFAFEVTPDGKTEYQPGEDLVFELVLIGRGIAHLPFFILAFKALGEEGLGKGRGRFQVKQVWALDPLGPWKTLIYDGPSDTFRTSDLSVGIAEIEAVGTYPNKNEIIVSFLTPTRIKHAGEIVNDLPFHILVRNTIRRLSSLYYFHCGQRWETDYRGLIEAAKAVEIEKAELRWQNWGRNSGRQQQWIEMGGVIGTVKYVGPVADFRSLLTIGSLVLIQSDFDKWISPFYPEFVHQNLSEKVLVHVGKGAVFGNGQFKVE